MGSTTTTKDTSSSSTPWGPQASALTSAFNNAQNAYGTASQAQAPTDFTAQFTPDQLATFNSMLGYSNNNSIPGTTANTSNTMQNAGSNATAGALSGLGSYDPTKLNNTQAINDAANQYVAGQNIPAQVANAMFGATQQAQQVTMPGIEQNAAQTGNTNSSRTGIADGLVQESLANQAANLSATMQGQAYANGLNLASSNANANNANTLGALTGAAAAGTAATNSGVNAGTSSITDQGNLFNMANAAGAGEQAANQTNLTNQLQQYQSQVSSPYDALNGLMGIIGSKSWGSNTTGTDTSTSTPSATSVIGGLLGAAGQAKSLFSDRRVKEDIVRVGTLDNGLPVYTFRYIGNPTVHMGLMAQDVEQVKPEAVTEIHGIKAVNYEMASA
jgi:hypothetical protein